MFAANGLLVCYSDNRDQIDDLIKDDGNDESPATTPNVLVRQVGMDGTLYTIVDDEDLVDAILLDADKAITFRLEIRGELCDVLSDTIPSANDKSGSKSERIKLIKPMFSSTNSTATGIEQSLKKK